MGEPLQPHQQRIVDEKNELEDKLTKLRNFIGGDIYNGLPEEDRDLLSAQVKPMDDYLFILNARIKRFTEAA